MKNGVRKISITPELKIEIPSQFSVTGVRELRVPSFRNYLEKDNAQFVLRTLPVVARAASVRYHDSIQNKDITLRRVDMIAAKDGHTQVPMTFVERFLDAQNHMGLLHQEVTSLEDIGLAANQLKDKFDQRSSEAGISSHT